VKLTAYLHLSAEVKNTWSYTFTRLVKYRNKFTFTLGKNINLRRPFN